MWLDEMMEVIQKEIGTGERMMPTSVPQTRRLSKKSPTAAALLTGLGNNPICTYC